MQDKWSPQQYEKFKEQRAQPFWDLLDLVQGRGFKKAVDLGCGTGELTKALHEKLNCGQTLGMDSSAKMLERAAAFVIPGLSFAQLDIQDFNDSYDLVFSNAALQWVSGHRQLFPKLATLVNPDGEIAIQMPANHDHPSHRLAREIAGANAREVSVLPVEEYATILYTNGFPNPHCRLQVYGHPMPEGNSVVEWVRGTLLTDYEKKFSPADFEVFLNEYKKRLLAEIGTGPYFYTFKRILLWGKKE